MTSIIELLRVEHSKKQTELITAFIGADSKKIKELIDILIDNDEQLSQRAAWVVTHLAKQHRASVSPYFQLLVSNLNKPLLHDAVIRNTLKLFEGKEYTIDASLEDELTNHCFNYLIDKNIPVAIKAFSMSILEKIVGNYPELKSELIFELENQLPYASAGFKSRATKILKKLKS